MFQLCPSARMFTWEPTICVTVQCAAGSMKCASTWGTGTSSPYLYVKRVKTNQEFHLIALILLCQNWQVSEGLTEHLIVFQNTQKKLNFSHPCPSWITLYPFHVAGSVQRVCSWGIYSGSACVSAQHHSSLLEMHFSQSQQLLSAGSFIKYFLFISDYGQYI